mgnify:CR=1 FL=1
MATSIEMFAGDTKKITVTVKNNSGTIVNLNGLENAKLQAIEVPTGRAKKNTLPKIIKEMGDGSVNVSNAANGEIVFTINPDDTRNLVGNYYYEIEITDSYSNVLTVATGTLVIKESIIS